MLNCIFQSRIALAEQLRKSKELTQKVGISLNEAENSEDSDDDQIEVPEQIIDPDNPWLAERKEFTDFMDGYKSFVQNNSNSTDKNDHDEKSKSNKEDNEPATLVESNIIKQKNDEMINPIKKVLKKKKKIKNITIEDLSVNSDEESDIEILKIVDPHKKKVHFSDDILKPKTNLKIIENNSNNKNESTIPQNKKNNIEIIQTTAGTWFVSSDNVNCTNSKKKKMHKDVENAFKTVETELKNKINEKLVNLKNVKDIKSHESDLNKRKCQEENSDYLKINNKRTKAEFNEPLYEENKTLNQTNLSNIKNNYRSDIKIEEKPTKEAQNIDPTAFVHVAQTNLETEEMAQVEDCLDDKEENEQDKLIAEAFADDDIINEFKYVIQIVYLLLLNIDN